MPDRLSMRVTFALTAWMLSVVSSSSPAANTLPDIKNEDFIKDCVRTHNKFRSAVTPAASDMLYMTWDPLLAQIAKAWASHCEFAHNQQLKPPHKLHPNFTSLGENLWTGSLSIFSVSSAITDWYDEVKYYDFKTRKCNKVCGHYTQKNFLMDSFILLHRGNYPTWPYKKGSTCSACSRSDNCLDNLCTNPQRDKVTRYYSIVFPDWPIYPRDRNTSLFLIIIPPILILSVIIIIWAKGKYPHLFTLK
ncbi:hypothetical protein FD755_009479 [Muntiacus reevesi]|uniref:SCP domain-containing protein n=1 Tax=Muntiacus reevesi TaxID=9886 RepID=A0A5N3XVQ7_MUNRE|nr:hypothetical protein FD755_009479 [Muntiacus reevesi]